MIDRSDTSALLNSALDGDVDAAEELLNRHRDRLKRMVAVRMHTLLTARFDPSDVVQEAMIVASKRLPKYLREQPVDFYPWLRQLTYERLVDLHRRHFERAKRSVRREFGQEIPLPDASSVALVNRLIDNRPEPGSQLVRKELRARVRSSLDSLPDIYREVLVLRHLEQLTNEEAARVLGVTDATAKTRYFRGIQRLHSALSDTDSEA